MMLTQPVELMGYMENLNHFNRYCWYSNKNNEQFDC